MFLIFLTQTSTRWLSGPYNSLSSSITRLLKNDENFLFILLLSFSLALAACQKSSNTFYKDVRRRNTVSTRLSTLESVQTTSTNGNKNLFSGIGKFFLYDHSSENYLGAVEYQFIHFLEWFFIGFRSKNE